VAKGLFLLEGRRGERKHNGNTSANSAPQLSRVSFPRPMSPRGCITSRPMILIAFIL
jgi:hypothetical protein